MIIGTEYVPSIVTSAAAIASSGLPLDRAAALADVAALEDLGRASAIESASVATCGSTSYSTLMARTASRACSSVSAATAAMSSPW